MVITPAQKRNRVLFVALLASAILAPLIQPAGVVWTFVVLVGILAPGTAFNVRLARREGVSVWSVFVRGLRR